MKASELAEELMKHPDATVCIEYIPYGEPTKIIATFYPGHNISVLEFENDT